MALSLSLSRSQDSTRAYRGNSVIVSVFRIIIICYERLLQHRFFSIFFFTYETSQQWFNLSSSFEILQTLSL